MNARRLARFALPVVAVAFFAVMATNAFATGASLPLTLTSGGKAFPVPASLVSTGSVVDTAGVTAWVGAIGGQVDRAMVNSSLKLNAKKKRLDFKASRIGYKLNRPGAVALICAALPSVDASSAPSTLALPTTATNPKTVSSSLKTILVVKSQRKIYLYKNATGKVEKTYRCAIGQPAWPTPSGTFYIGKKNPHPTWTNGYASWSKNMPSFIGPGPNNPLGTRALYVYSKKGGDTGVRFHGVPPSENSSIGHAASHGCLRMLRKNVEDFYPRVPLKTTVYIIK